MDVYCGLYRVNLCEEGNPSALTFQLCTSALRKSLRVPRHEARFKPAPASLEICTPSFVSYLN
jgi:hypothetical protein